MKLSPIEKVLLNEVFSRTFFCAMKSKYSGSLLKSTFPLYKKYNIWGTTQTVAFRRILLERRATGFVLVVGINRSGNTGGILHGVVVTPFVIFFLGNLPLSELTCLFIPGSEVIKKLRIGWIIRLLKTKTDFSINICNLEAINIF